MLAKLTNADSQYNNKHMVNRNEHHRDDQAPATSQVDMLQYLSSFLVVLNTHEPLT